MNRYMGHFNLNQKMLDATCVYTNLVRSSIIRKIAQWVLPERQTTRNKTPVNLMKSQRLVWVINRLDLPGNRPRPGEAVYLPWRQHSNRQRLVLQPQEIPQPVRRM